MRTPKVSAILLAAVVVGCVGDAPTAAKATPEQAQATIGVTDRPMDAIEAIVAALDAASSFSVDNGAWVARVRDERSYADTVSSCGSEPIAVEATVVRREQIVFLPSGGLHRTYHVVVRMHGTGLSTGVRYVGQISWVEASVYRGPDSGVPRTETRTIRLHGVTQGPTDNVFETITFETIYDEHGGNTVVIKGKAGCYG